ncbi:glycine cleavage system protein GcvH [Rivularia sp. UHCC 0363]|uniref:glycine cleavage system protein GcvH n=1 Tax=Rivularia sp. UHCC 0363 TaxID=3110244 RepID=UPI002B2086EE|nr:glycine cleavage system protein GcvH [Rivularia sp. UHCC 0363]MEA5592887.1 glycine cleavage system protein GcvH [Rivularia sp. UHCC 0363]
MAFEYPEDLKYLDSHEYVRLEGENATIGISAFAIDQLGDIVFLELPGVGDRVTKGETFGTVESVKAVEDLNSPVTGTVTKCNDAMMDSPEKLADEPYGKGWLIEVKVENPADIDDAMSAKEYKSKVEGE